MKPLIFFIFGGLALFTVSCKQASKEESEWQGFGLCGVIISEFNNPVKKLLFAEDDIISFNLATREIIFTNVVTERLTFCSFDGFSTKMNFFLDGKPLFDSAIYLVCGISSFSIHDLVFYYSIEEDSKYFFNDGYPLFVDGGIYPDEIIKVREENIQKRKIGWDTFVDHLSKADKIVIPY